MVVKRQAFEALGGFDEKLRSGEDADFLIRLHQSYTMKTHSETLVFLSDSIRHQRS